MVVSGGLLGPESLFHGKFPEQTYAGPDVTGPFVRQVPAEPVTQYRPLNDRVLVVRPRPQGLCRYLPAVESKPIGGRDMSPGGKAPTP